MLSSKQGSLLKHGQVHQQELLLTGEQALQQLLVALQLGVILQLLMQDFH